MDTRKISRIDEQGGQQPSESAEHLNGSPKPSGGTAQPERATERVAGFDTISPFDIESGAANGGSGDTTGFDFGGEPRRRRGRPPGSRNKAATTQTAQDLVKDLESLLGGLSMMAAAFFKTAELQLDPTESERLSKSIENFARHYSVAIDPRKLAAFDLTAVSLSIVVPRVYTLYKKSESKDRTPKPVPVPDKQQPQKVKQDQPAPLITHPSQIWSAPPVDDFGV